jgi:hypothetical protein
VYIDGSRNDEIEHVTNAVEARHTDTVMTNDRGVSRKRFMRPRNNIDQADDDEWHKAVTMVLVLSRDDSGAWGRRSPFLRRAA